jgi:thioredoxin reductase (NADPH)
MASGATYRRLGVPAVEALSHAGVFYGGPASVAPALTGKDAYVVGGGNSAGQAVLHLARYARHVTLLVRARSLEVGMSHYLIQEIEATPNIDVRVRTEIVDGHGESHLQQLVLHDVATGRHETVAADALVVLIGAIPRTDWLPPAIAKDPSGFLLTGEEVAHDSNWPIERRPHALETSMPRGFAAGDVRRSSIKRVASAVGEGSIAIRLILELFANERLQTVGESAAAPGRAL